MNGPVAPVKAVVPGKAVEAVEAVEAVDWKNVAPRPCPVAESLDLFGDRWSMLVIRDVMNGVRRFDDLVGRLEISRATLSDRLRRLTAAGILEPALYDSGRGRTRTEYRLTARGWELRNVLIALREWGDRHVLGEGNETLALVDRMTGHRVRLQLIDEETGEAVDARRLRHVMVPAFENAFPPTADGGEQLSNNSTTPGGTTT